MLPTACFADPLPAPRTWLREGMQPAEAFAALAQMRIQRGSLFSAGNRVHIKGAVGGHQFVAADNESANAQFQRRRNRSQPLQQTLPRLGGLSAGDDLATLLIEAFFAVATSIFARLQSTTRGGVTQSVRAWHWPVTRAARRKRSG